MEKPTFRPTTMPLLAVVVVLLAGCSAISQQSVYEGLRVKRNTEAAGTNPPNEPLPSYEKYKQDRDAAR